MNRDRRNSFGRTPTCVSTSPVPRTAEASLLAARRQASAAEAEATDQQQTKGRLEALGLIICRLDEMRQLAASHGLEPIGYLLDVAFTESCDAIRRERSSAEAQETTR
ncbi:hypothetical protein [Mesorhizobium sp. CO1-1-8]|uniref:hypothetical protein n=1 Tax=Mesorhizobium sp. CO1-1-8 TaxID=2876631 RepID=UPI001CD08B6A|nr:hypothetical protein [Mesorhizobium sp. CO1-1-8]MBZ9772556.1 hypothetical protein [Mesorhizobium sp. CO1-1-8]